MNTYPNQKIIHINKKSYKSNFLQVGIEEWQEAFQQLKPSTFAVYLYLASNADGFDLALSQKAVEKALNIKKTAYHSAIAELKEKGYIGTMQGNIDYFFTSPVRKCGLTEDSANANMEVRKNGQGCPQTRIGESAKTDKGVRKNDREIDKINNINKINNIDNAAFSSEAEKPKNSEIIVIENEKDNFSFSRFRDEEEQGYFDFIKGANIEKGMSETAAEKDAWQMILDDREYWDSKVKIS